jgi:hypothetical protein
MHTCELSQFERETTSFSCQIFNYFLRIRDVLKSIKKSHSFSFQNSLLCLLSVKNLSLFEINSPSWIDMYVHVMHKKSLNVLMSWPVCFSDILSSFTCFVSFCLWALHHCMFICRSLKRILIRPKELLQLILVPY